MTRLSVRSLTKRYGATQALAGLDLDIEGGQVLGIAGPNGAGKSTLVRMLGGFERPDAGSFDWEGEDWQPWQPPSRVTVVHQEPQLFSNLTVAANLAVQTATGAGWPRTTSAHRAVLDELGLGEFADRRLGTCSLAVRQLTAIAQALGRNAELLLFDEPNSALTEEESNALFRVIHQLAERGKLVVLITHRLSDFERHCERVAVVLDGRVSTILSGGEVTEERIGRELVAAVDTVAAPSRGRPPRVEASDRDGIRLRGFSHSRGAFRDVDLDLCAGEVTVLVGAEGGGARELLLGLAGLAAGRGTIEKAGLAAERPTEYCAADRGMSLFHNTSVAGNLVSRLGRGEIAGAAGLLRSGQMREIAERLREDYTVRARDVGQPIGSLSGGNQQKVAIAAAVARRPGVLVLEEPTRGVDIASKAEIYAVLREFAAAGRVVVLLATELLEAFEVGDRVVVIEDGSVIGETEVAAYPEPAELAAGVAAVRADRYAAP